MATHRSTPKTSRTVWAPVGDFFGTGYQIHPTRFRCGSVRWQATA